MRDAAMIILLTLLAIVAGYLMGREKTTEAISSDCYHEGKFTADGRLYKCRLVLPESGGEE